MFVLTVDQRGSRHDIDRVADLLIELADCPLLRGFERTAGDELQAVTDDACVAVNVALNLVRRRHWHVGIGIGPVEEPLPLVTRAGRGPAFHAARLAVTRAKRTLADIATTGVDTIAAADVEAVMTLLGLLIIRRTPEGHEAVTLMAEGLTQNQAAAKLGITKQAVSQRLTAAGWQAEGPARVLAERLMRRADRKPGEDS